MEKFKWLLVALAMISLAGLGAPATVESATLIRTFPTPVAGLGFPKDGGLVGLAYGAGSLWAVSYDSRVWQLSPIDGTVLKSFPIPEPTVGLAFDGGLLYTTSVGDNSGTIYVIDPGAEALVREFQGPVSTLAGGMTFLGPTLFVVGVAENGLETFELNNLTGQLLSQFSMWPLGNTPDNEYYRPRELDADGRHLLFGTWSLDGSGSSAPCRWTVYTISRLGAVLDSEVLFSKPSVLGYCQSSVDYAYDIGGMAWSDGELFVADRASNTVYVYGFPISPPTEDVCNGADDDGDTLIDEGCDDDGDGFCDAGLGYTGSPAVCPHGSGDCDDAAGSTYPDAPEVNDGLDNQCPGNHGMGVVDEISGFAGFDSPNAPNELCWPEQSRATSYEVVQSADPTFASGCVAYTVPGPCLTLPDQPPLGGGYFFLVRTIEPFVGSWGSSSMGERVVPCMAPDLIVESLTHSPQNPTEGPVITFTAIVRNVGAGRAGASVLSLGVGGETPGTSEALFAVPALDPGQGVTYQRQATLLAGSYMNTAIADFQNQVRESDEANNQAHDVYVVSSPP